MDAGLGRSRTLPPGVESELKLNFSLLLWAPSELTSRQGGRGRPGRLGFLSSSDSLPPSPPPHPFSPPRRVGRPPPLFPVSPIYMSMRPPFRRAWRWPWRLWERGALGSCFSSLIPGVIIALVGRGRWLRRLFGLVFPGRRGSPVPPAGDPGARTKRPALEHGEGTESLWRLQTGPGADFSPYKVQSKLEFRARFSATANFIFCLCPTHFSGL